MIREHYLLPAALCADALSAYRDAQRTAWQQQHALLSKFNAVSISRRGQIGEGLVLKAPNEIDGFFPPKELSAGGYDGWLVKPRLNSPVGVQVKQELNVCATLLHELEWSLEKSLGIYTAVFHDNHFHYHIATPLSDGSIVISAPVVKSKKYSRQTHLLPRGAKAISHNEHQAMVQQARGNRTILTERIAC